MREAYLIRHDDLMALQNSVQDLCDQLIMAAEDCRQMIGRFRENGSMDGEFFRSVRDYLSDVHGKVLQALEQIARQLKEKVRAYVAGLTAMDAQSGFVFAGIVMEEFWNGLRREYQELEACAGSIDQALQEVSDLVGTSGLAMDLPEAATHHVSGCVAKLQEEIRAHEAFFEKDLGSLHGSFTELQQLMGQMCSGAEADPAAFSVRALSAWIGTHALKELITGAQLKEAGFGEEEILHMARYGYDATDLVKLAEACVTDADREFLLDLAGGDYDSAFAEDPSCLSESMSLIAADYAGKLYASGDLSGLEGLVNAILLQNNGIGWFQEPAPGVHTIRQGHLENLFRGTMVLLELNSSMLLQGLATEEMKERNWELMAMANLWNAQYHLDEELTYRRDPLHPPRVVIRQIDQEGHSMDYTYMYTAISHNPFQMQQEVISIDVSADILETSSDLMSGMYLAERGRLQEASDQLMERILGESIWKAGNSIISVAIPELGMALKMAESAIEKDIFDADDHLIDLTRKMHLTNKDPDSILLGEAIDGLQAYLDKNTELSDKIGQLDKLYEGSLWGTGFRSSYTVPDAFSSGSKVHIMSGIYNPDYLETIGNWNREGITALLPEADMIQIAWVMEQYPEYAGIGPDQLVYKMIYGFGPESILDYPVHEVAEAKQIVEEIIREVYNRGDYAFQWNVEKAF